MPSMIETSNARIVFWNGSLDPKQQELKHREIAERHRRKAKACREKRPFNIAVLRVAEIDRWFAHRYGGTSYVLPDDDAGRDDAFVMVTHLAQCPIAPKRIRESWLKRATPWMSAEERERLLARKTLKFSADKLAWRLGVTYALRKDLDLRSIGACDVSKAERVLLRKVKDRLRKQEKRRAEGAKPQAESASRTKPWEAEGISKATYYRRRRSAAMAENEVRQVRPSYGSEASPYLNADEVVSSEVGKSEAEPPCAAGEPVEAASVTVLHRRRRGCRAVRGRSVVRDLSKQRPPEQRVC